MAKTVQSLLLEMNLANMEKLMKIHKTIDTIVDNFEEFASEKNLESFKKENERNEFSQIFQKILDSVEKTKNFCCFELKRTAKIRHRFLENKIKEFNRDLQDKETLHKEESQEEKKTLRTRGKQRKADTEKEILAKKILFETDSEEEKTKEGEEL